jgi:hypothetical protein
VTAVVGGGVLIDLDKNDVRITCMFFDPVSINEYFLPAHVVSFLLIWCVAQEPRASTDDRTERRKRRAAATASRMGRLETTRTRLYIRRS